MIIRWPLFLIFLAVIPLLAGLYWWAQHRRRKVAIRYSSLVLIRLAQPRPSRLKKYLPAGLFLLALASLIVSVARPAVVKKSSVTVTTIILVMDVSKSMMNNDIQPTRLDAAKSAALSFIRSQKFSGQIGIVTFADQAQLIQPPTADQQLLETAIQSLTIEKGTAIGSGILKALEVIAQVHQTALPTAKPIEQDTAQIPVAGQTNGQDAHVPVKYLPEIIVLMTDGSNNSGPLLGDAARLAAEQGVRIYTIGYGPEFNPDYLKNRQLNSVEDAKPNIGIQNRERTFFDYSSALPMSTLRLIARITGGKAYTAVSISELEDVFATLPVEKTEKLETLEISVVFIGLGVLLTIISLVLGTLWNPLP